MLKLSSMLEGRKGYGKPFHLFFIGVWPKIGLEIFLSESPVLNVSESINRSVLSNSF